MGDIDDVCVVTHPLSDAGENATRTLLDIISAITSVALVTANLPPDSKIRDTHEVIEISQKDEGKNVLVAAARFLINQVRMSVVLARRDESIVIFYGATSYLLPILTAKLRRKTVVLEPRGDVPLTLRLHWEHRLPSIVARTLAGSVWLLERTGYRLADGIIAYTPAMASELNLNTFEKKLYPHGARYVDTERFSPNVPFTERETVVGFLGRLDGEKGIRTLAEVARGLPEEITFRFVGSGDCEEWLKSELQDQIDAGTVEMAGWVDHNDVPQELNRMRLLVMPSQPTEGLPTVILESLACGTPVYATPVSGVPDVVYEGETGLLMKDLEPEAIRADIVQFLDSDTLDSVSANGRKLAVSEFSFEAAVDRYRSILQDLSYDA